MMDIGPNPFPSEESMLVTYAVCHLCGMSSACTNPILYGFLNRMFKDEFKQFFGGCSKVFRSVVPSSSAPPTQSVHFVNFTSEGLCTVNVRNGRNTTAMMSEV